MDGGGPALGEAGGHGGPPSICVLWFEEGIVDFLVCEPLTLSLVVSFSMFGFRR